MAPKKISDTIKPESPDVVKPTKISKPKKTESSSENVEKITKSKKKAEVVESIEPTTEKVDEPIKVTKPKKEVKVKKVETEETIKPTTEETIKPTKAKKEVKAKKSETTDMQQYVKETIKQPESNIFSDPETYIKEKLEETKTHWLSIVDNIHKCNLELEKLEIEKNKTVKELKELLDKLQTDDPKLKGFMIDNKIHTTSIKNDIIPVDCESTSESDVSESESDEKHTLLTKKDKQKSIIKTTKGNAKNIKLVTNDSESDSD